VELKNIYGNVIFASESAKTVLELVIAARAAKADLRVTDLRGSDLRVSNLRGSNLRVTDLRGSDLRVSNLSYSDLRVTDLSYSDLRVSNLRGSDLRYTDLRGSDLSYSDLSYSDLRYSNLRGALIDGRPIVTMRVFGGLYPYTVQAVLFQDGSRWVRMGCLWKSLDEWEAIGIRKSNMSEFPDDGSDRCEERVAAFEFAKANALRLKETQ
jgi:hypothetical protein